MITVADFAIDVAVKITPSFKAKATTHPVGKNATVSDHLIDDPDTLTIECIVSDTPSGDMVAIRANSVTKPTQAAFAKFLALKADKTVFSVVTNHRTYTNMVLLEFTPSFDKETGEALRFVLQMQALTFVQNDRQFVKVAMPIAASKSARGDKAGKQTPSDAKADRNSSILWKLTH